MKITQEQRVIMRNQKIQLILLGNKLTSIHCQFNNPNYSFINEYISVNVEILMMALKIC